MWCGRSASNEKSSFEIKTNSDGREYMQLNYNESTKKSDGTNLNEMNEHQIILSQPNSPQTCPIHSFKFYLQKLTDMQCLFQQPNCNL